MNSQLSLALRLRDEATFTNFLAVGKSRAQACELLSSEPLPETHLIYLWGGSGSGVSHLAQAACHHYRGLDVAGQYLPLGEFAGMDGADVLEGLEHQPLVCLEDVQCIGGDFAWERALFNLYNRALAQGNLLLVTANTPPAGLSIQLPDLISRLSSGLVFYLPSYSDEERLEILRFRAARLGLDFSADVARFLLHRCSRDLDDLMAVVRRLDAASLQAKRRVTIPFIKEVLEW